MLFNAQNIIQEMKPVSGIQENKEKIDSLKTESGNSIFIDDSSVSLTKAIGKLEQRKTTHYYSHGNFNLVRLILFILKQTGSAHVFMTSYSFSQKSIAALKNRLDKNEILSLRVIVDNRVRSLSPKPFQMLAKSFNYRCSSVHAKVALLWNDHWKISIVTSQNATDNPKLERGVIFTNETVFQFDYNALENEFNNGTT